MLECNYTFPCSRRYAARSSQASWHDVAAYGGRFSGVAVSGSHGLFAALRKELAKRYIPMFLLEAASLYATRAEN